MKIIVLGMTTFLFATSISFADNPNTTKANDVTQQTTQKAVQLSDNDQPPGWSRGNKEGWENNHNKNWNQHNQKHHKHHKHHQHDNDNDNFNHN